MSGQSILVFGGSGGIGGAIVDAVRLQGARAIGCDLAPEADDPGKFACDATDENSVDRAIGHAIGSAKRLDGIVHCVGTASPGPLEQTSLSDWDRVIRTNLTSAFLIARAGLSALRDSRGSLLLISSSSARDGGSTESGPAYAASKAGMNNLVRYLAREWAPHGIRVNAIAPGPVDTPMMRAAGAARRDAYAMASLTGQIADPAEIGAMAGFLLSQHARSITGAIINQSGGRVLD